MSEQFMIKAIEEAQKAKNVGEKIGFGAVIVKNNQIISVAHNTAKKSIDPTNFFGNFWIGNSDLLYKIK